MGMIYMIVKMKAEAKETYVPTFVSGEMETNFVVQL
jgi:hypothetical protein